MILQRLRARGPAIALAILLILLVTPTPLPVRPLDVWHRVSLAVAGNELASADPGIDTLLSYGPWQPYLLGDAVRIALAAGEPSRALQLLSLPAAPESLEDGWQCLRVRALLDSSRLEEALSAIETTSVPCGDAAAWWRQIGEAHLRAGQLEPARQAFGLALDLEPQALDIQTRLGILDLLEEPSGSSARLAEAASAGDALALDLNETLLASEPADRAGTLAQSGLVLIRHSEWELAASALRKSLELQPANAEAHAYLGLAMDMLGQDGLPELEAAVAASPGSALTHGLLGVHWQQQGQALQAKEQFTEALKIDPSNAELHASLGAAQAELGETDDALQSYRQAAEMDPKNPFFWGVLARYALDHEIRIAETALPAARNAAALQPDAETLDTLGYAHFLLGDTDLAVRLFEDSILREPTLAAPRLHLGLLMASAGNLDAARAQLHAAASLDPQGEAGLRALRSLEQLSAATP